MTTKHLWKIVQENLEVEITSYSYMTWMRNCTLKSYEEMGDERQVATIACLSSYHQQIIEKRFHNQLKQTLDRVTRKQNELKFEVDYSLVKKQHVDEVKPGSKVLMVDDLLATGGTMAAACKLIEKIAGQVYGIAFLIELSELGGRDQGGVRGD